MAWREELRQASFKGVQFFVEAHTASGGRRTIVTEFPDRDVPDTEDKGRKARSFKIEAYILGDNYFNQRDQLINACENGTEPGELVHPFLGSRIVRCENYSFSETKTDGRYVQFSLEFVEAGQELFPNQNADVNANVIASADALSAASQNSFADKFSVLRKPQFVTDSATGKVGDFTKQLTDSLSGITSASEGTTDFAFSVRNLNAKTLDLVKTPSNLAAQMASSIGFLKGASNSPKDTFGELKKFFKFGSSDKPIPQTTPTRVAQAVNQKSLNDLTKQLAFVEAAKVAIEIPLQTSEEAASLKQELLAALDEQTLETDDDNVYQAQIQLMSDLAKAIPEPAQDLAFISKVQNNQTTNSLVLTHDYYENITFETDLIDRNKISHPGFIIGGRELEILNDE
ncbi:MAG: hypothetical protein BWY19_00796 [bacterium ADurb.Bin212]|nr:MAG: hypothetical protein BWY19_00796 [bacterium ADurb.Bin212]